MGRGYSAKTIAVYLVTIARAAAWLGAQGSTLEEAPPTLLHAYAETLPLTRSSRALLRSALRAYWSASGRPEGPARAIRVPSKPPMRCKALEDPEAWILANAARRRGDPQGLAVLLGLYAGLRRNEIATLRWSQIEPSGWLALVGKGDVSRAIPLHPVILEALEALPHPSHTVEREGPGRSEWVFPGRFGGPANPSTIWGWVRAVALEAGLAAVPTHVLRHTALSTALDATRDLRAVQQLAGHARPETTAGYTRVRRDRLVETVTAICYDELSA